ncbi:MAG: SDR family oxidoreductase [Pseudomonadales bacterium]|nr:SDR family oxidoreductase [Halioglobus sp.]MCP5131634.1 SDR family oxidoreductase [Pseudomonadales bacterium]
MKVLITGATGFIGNHVTRLCLEQGDEVRVMVMPGEDRSPLNGMDVEFVEGNLLDPSSLAKCVEGVEGLYHLAAVYAVWTKDPTLQYRVNVEGANAMLRAAMAAGVKKVVFTSSIAAIGIARPGELANEDTMFNAWEFANDYVLSKFISHQMVKGLVAEGLPATIVCPGFPFGPGDRMPTPTGKLIIAILQGKMKNYFDGGMCAVDVRDVAKGHVLAMEKGRIGESYVLANREGNMSQRDLARLVGRVAGVPDVATKEVPSWVMKVAARLMEFWADLTGKPPMTTYKTSMFALQKIYVDPSKAINELGMPQTPIETAVNDAAKWFRDNRYV